MRAIWAMGPLVGPLFLAVCLALASCGSPRVVHEGDTALDARAYFSPTPPMVGVADLRVDATLSGEPLPEGSSVTAVPLNPSGVAGDEVVLEERRDGAWIGVVTFTAPGESRIELRLAAPGGRTAVLRYPVTVTRRP